MRDCKTSAMGLAISKVYIPRGFQQLQGRNYAPRKILWVSSRSLGMRLEHRRILGGFEPHSHSKQPSPLAAPNIFYSISVQAVHFHGSTCVLYTASSHNDVHPASQTQQSIYLALSSVSMPLCSRNIHYRYLVRMAEAHAVVGSGSIGYR